MALLEIEDLTLAIGETEILKGVSLTLEAGEILGLVGESGSGKSMTSMSILRLLPPQARVGGTAKLAGEDLLALEEPAMRRLRGADIGVVFSLSR